MYVKLFHVKKLSLVDNSQPKQANWNTELSVQKFQLKNGSVRSQKYIWEHLCCCTSNDQQIRQNELLHWASSETGWKDLTHSWGASSQHHNC